MDLRKHHEDTAVPMGTSTSVYTSVLQERIENVILKSAYLLDETMAIPKCAVGNYSFHRGEGLDYWISLWASPLSPLFAEIYINHLI